MWWEQGAQRTSAMGNRQHTAFSHTQCVVTSVEGMNEQTNVIQSTLESYATFSARKLVLFTSKTKAKTSTRRWLVAVQGLCFSASSRRGRQQ